MTAIANRRGYSPAATCFGWTCPNGHHSISAVGPVPACARCGARKPGKAYVPYLVRQARRRRRYSRPVETLAQEGSLTERWDALMQVGRIEFPPRSYPAPLPRGVPMSTAVVPEDVKVYKVSKVVSVLLRDHISPTEFLVPGDYELKMSDDWLVLPDARVATKEIVWVRLESKTLEVS